MKRALCVVSLLCASSAFAMETQVLPQGAWMLDLSYWRSSIDKQWGGNRQALPLIEENRRYEPGAGLQGILAPRPKAEFDFLFIQLMYGITDRLSAAVYIPLVLRSHVSTNIQWTPGDYQSPLGRSYSEDDFWAWAGTLGQPRVPADWEGGFQMSDMILGARYLLPEFEWMKEHHFRWSGTLQVALPTGSNFDPEAAVSVGTNLWELHAAGDVEVHLSADKQFFVDEYGVPKLNIGADVFYSFFRPRQYKAGRGLQNPLLNNNAPYIGDTYIVDGGDWIGGTVSVDIAPFMGPTLPSIVSGHDLKKANALPPIFTLTLSYTRVQTFQSDWQSQSALWDYDREKYWQPGEKNILKATANVSLMRVGLPLQIYARYQAGDIIPGRYTRPANIFTAGVRVIAKFW
ncbi:MAG: hypothetical protein DI536_16225 [Archangium gephyra]|uniref:Uncharacterized protein n=1 Tax=Archangium gephyra TaxID=48 RepID=A0A2W5T8N6_9BACT|nr:MAG: hypothetical protein DI536_16225 [Archangium gephyra]